MPTTIAPPEDQPIEAPAASDSEYIRPLSASQMLLYAAGGIAGGLVFTMMNNALPLFLKYYTMPADLPLFFSPGREVPATVVALLTNERSLFGGLVQPLVGSLSDRTSSRIGKRSPYILAGGLGTGAAIALLGLQPPFWTMVLLVTVAGIALFVAMGPYIALLADIAPPAQRGRLGGLMAIGGVIGAIGFTLLSAQLWESNRGWVFLLTGIAVTVTMVLVALGVREPPSTPATLSRLDHGTLSTRMREMRSYRPLFLYTLAMGVYWLGAGAAAPFVTRFATEELGVSESNALSLVLVLVLATAVGALVAGFLADRIGRKRVLGPGLALFAVASIIASQVTDITQAIPAIVLVGLGNSVPTALHLPLLADLVPRAGTGALMGLSSMVWSVAQPVGSFLSGIVVDITGSFRGIFIFAGLCMFAAFLILQTVKVPGEETKLTEYPSER